MRNADAREDRCQIIDETLSSQDQKSKLFDHQPKAFFASRADMVFMADSRGDPLPYLGQNSSFWQRRFCGFDPGREQPRRRG